MRKRSVRLVATLLLALTMWGTASNWPVQGQTAPTQQLAADPGGSGTGNGG